MKKTSDNSIGGRKIRGMSFCLHVVLSLSLAFSLLVGRDLVSDLVLCTFVCKVTMSLSELIT